MRTISRVDRRAFTLIELIVVIAIIGVLIVLILPSAFEPIFQPLHILVLGAVGVVGAVLVVVYLISRKS
jgi:prepilin-type N-terminal cleavage/methylation domain-containing protein